MDAGLSRKETFERLAAIGVASDTLTAILITHEHSDHIAGLQVIARKLDIPIYMSRMTAPAIFGKDTPWAEDYTPKLELFAAGSVFQVGDIDVTSFTIPHDAADPVGFSFRAEGVKISIATDLGYMPDSIRFHLRRLRRAAARIQSRRRDAEGGPIPVGAEAAHHGSQRAFVERRGLQLHPR